MLKLDPQKILFTGGSGLLGRAIQAILPEADFPSSQDFDVTNLTQMEKYLQRRELKILGHLAAFTAVAKCEEDPLPALETNIIGTANIVKLCQKFGLKLFYVSTDYVFRGDHGNYRETAEVLPINKYAWSKLGGECAVRLYANSVIIRTSLGATVFPYAKAFSDQFTSRESAPKIAQKIIKLLTKDFKGVIHLGGKRQTVLEYAKALEPTKKIGKFSIKEVSFPVPHDTSLNTAKYQKLFGKA